MVRLLKRYLILGILALGLFFMLFKMKNTKPPPPAKHRSLVVATYEVLSVLSQVRTAEAIVLPNQNTVLREPFLPGMSCQADRGSGLFLLVMVISSPANYERRALIRSVFSEMRPQWEDAFFYEKNQLAPNDLNVTRLFQVVFMVGKTSDGEILEEVQREWKTYRDVIVDDFHEAYLNLTLKTLRMLKWVVRNCPKASFLVKMDDDVFLNMPRLVSFLLPQVPSPSSRRLVAGFIHNKPPVRHPGSKWFTPVAAYKPKMFPPFIGGFCYILGMQGVHEIYEESLHHPLFHLEDVFLTGFIASKKLNFTLQQPGKVLSLLHESYRWRPVRWAHSYIIVHEVSPSQFRCWTRLTRSGGELGWTADYWPLGWTWPCFG